MSTRFYGGTVSRYFSVFYMKLKKVHGSWKFNNDVTLQWTYSACMFCFPHRPFARWRHYSTSGFSFLVVLLFETTRVRKLNCYRAGHFFPTVHALIGYFEVARYLTMKLFPAKISEWATL